MPPQKPEINDEYVNYIENPLVSDMLNKYYYSASNTNINNNNFLDQQY